MYEAFRRDELILRDLLARDRTVLANERTLLAYLRTAFAFAAGGVTLTQLPEQRGWMDWAAAVLVAAGVLTAAWGGWRFVAVRRRLLAIGRSAAELAVDREIAANETQSH